MIVNKITRPIALSAMLLLSAATVGNATQQAKNKSDSTRTEIPALNQPYSYYDRNGNLKIFNPEIGSTWQGLETENTSLNKLVSLFETDAATIDEKDYVMLERAMELADSYGSEKNETKNNGILENYEMEKLISKIQKGKLKKDELLKLQAPEIFEVNNWSEGLERRIRYIKIANDDDASHSKIKKELEEIGNKVGFKVAEVNMRLPWLEDYSIRRADTKSYFMPYVNDYMINSGDGNPVKAYRKAVADYDIIEGTSLLQGGNTLNTLSANGEPSAIIGDYSILHTLETLDWGITPDNIVRVQKIIAQDLGIKPENITYIPQIDYHIDMFYRPLHNGEIAIPDFDSAINFLHNNDFTSMDERQKNELISELILERDSSQDIAREAELILQKSGYKTIKIPCFSKSSDYGISLINHMNGIAGTSKDGTTYYITNKSPYPEIDKFVETAFKNAGVNDVFFVSTGYYLTQFGGIDCLTQEM